MKWTEEQLMAINEEGSNIIVSAGAGSGKTAVLSTRVLRKVKDGVNILNILILTFTNEAAGEMKNRIRKKLKSENLTEALECIDAAYITTFDAYALGMVKKYHYLLNISKNISIIDSSIIDLEKERIIEDIFLGLYAKKNKQFLKLVGDFTTRDDASIKRAILNINRLLDLKYDKMEYLDSYIDKYYDKSYVDELFLEYFNYIKSLCERIEADVYQLEGELEDKLYQKVYDGYSKVFKPRSYDDLYNAKIPSIQFRNISEEAKVVKEDLVAARKELEELIKYSRDELIEQIYQTKDYVEIIIYIIKELEEKLNKYKMEKEAFEFVDIAKMAIRIVNENPRVCEELKNSYNEILIDEYQDTNDLQEMFISLIANDNVYMVGDIKQSIYRFRNANPGIFKNKYDLYSKNIGGKKIDLVKNFRSRREVLANINLIFDLIMSEYAGGVNYKKGHEMVFGNMSYEEAGANIYDNNMEIYKYDNEDKEYSNLDIEAFFIANDIASKVKSKYQVYDFDLGTKRDARYSDFCIILDRGSDMPIYKKIFEYKGIPMDVYLDSDLLGFDDIVIIKNIIKLILLINKKDYGLEMKYAYTSVARSFIINLSDEEIFSLIKDNSFYDSNLYEICFKIAKDIESLSPSLLLKRIIDDFNYYEALIKVGNVSGAIYRIDYLIDLANSAEDLGFTIEDFLVYLDKMIEDGKSIKYKEVRGLGDCVKIMNIHKSKGLEFPICYFAGFYKTFNIRDLSDSFSFDKKYGIITPFYKEGMGTILTKTLVKNNYLKEEISEKIRLFYVALTRAKEKMIMVMPNFKKECKVGNVVAEEDAFQYRSFYNFLNSISLNLAEYIHVIDINKLDITMDYQFSIKKSREKFLDNKKIEFRNIKINSEVLQKKHASKNITSILNKEDVKKLEYGTSIHESLELSDLKNKNSKNKYVLNLRNKFNLDDPKIYQEYEFMYDNKDMEVHGIIDLMLEYDKEIKIIDYKLKNIDDEGYTKQLLTYYDYIKSISDKDVRLYLYSIIDDTVKEVNVDKVGA